MTVRHRRGTPDIRFECQPSGRRHSDRCESARRTPRGPHGIFGRGPTASACICAAVAGVLDPDVPPQRPNAAWVWEYPWSSP